MWQKGLNYFGIINNTAFFALNNKEINDKLSTRPWWRPRAQKKHISSRMPQKVCGDMNGFGFPGNQEWFRYSYTTDLSIIPSVGLENNFYLVNRGECVRPSLWKRLRPVRVVSKKLLVLMRQSIANLINDLEMLAGTQIQGQLSYENIFGESFEICCNRADWNTSVRGLFWL